MVAESMPCTRCRRIAQYTHLACNVCMQIQRAVYFYDL